MASQILTRRQLGKMRNENLIVSFLGLRDNILLQQNDLLQRNRDMSKKLLEIMSKINSLVKKNEELTSQLAMAQNSSKVLQEAFNTMSSKLVELKRNRHELKQYSKRECLDFSGIPSLVAPKDLENSVLRLLLEIDTELDKTRIVVCHRLGKKENNRQVFK